MADVRQYIRLVPARGIVRVDWRSDDPTFRRAPVDVYDMQSEGFPEDFGKKDKRTTVQPVFHCLACDTAEIKSLATLESHVKVNKKGIYLNGQSAGESRMSVTTTCWGADSAWRTLSATSSGLRHGEASKSFLVRTSASSGGKSGWANSVRTNLGLIPDTRIPLCHDS